MAVRSRVHEAETLFFQFQNKRDTVRDEFNQDKGKNDINVYLP